MDVLARQSSVVSLSRAHPLQSRCTHLASSEWQCSSVPVVLLHPSRWRAISNETPIIHLWSTDCSILQPRYCRQAGLSSLHCQSLEQSPCTSHISTVAHGFLSASYDFSLPVLLPWLNYLTLWAYILCGPNSNFVIQATLKMTLMIMKTWQWMSELKQNQASDNLLFIISVKSPDSLWHEVWMQPHHKRQDDCSAVAEHGYDSCQACSLQPNIRKCWVIRTINQLQLRQYLSDSTFNINWAITRGSAITEGPSVNGTLHRRLSKWIICSCFETFSISWCSIMMTSIFA